MTKLLWLLIVVAVALIAYEAFVLRRINLSNIVSDVALAVSAHTQSMLMKNRGAR